MEVKLKVDPLERWFNEGERVAILSELGEYIKEWEQDMVQYSDPSPENASLPPDPICGSTSTLKRPTTNTGGVWHRVANFVSGIFKAS